MTETYLKIDSATQTQTYYIKLANYKPLPENLNVTIRIPFSKTNDALVVPKSSIVTNVTQDSFWVMKLINDTTAVKENINKGIENDSIVQVLNSHLKPGNKIILSGAYGLPDTAKVEIRKMKNFYVTYKGPIAVILILILLGGIYSLLNIQSGLFPDITFPKDQNNCR